VLGYRSPVPLAKFQKAPMPSSHIPSGSKKKEPSTKLEEPCSFNKVPDGDNATLTRFFAVHFPIPFVIAAIVLNHGDGN
jgi:hypothetical protein